MRKLLFLCLFLTLPAICSAEIITVDDDGPADFNNIQSAIDASSDGDIIIVQPGHYDGLIRSSYPPYFYSKCIHFLGKNITLTSINPSNFDTVSSTVIEAAVLFKGTEGPNCVLSGFKIVGSEICGMGGIIGNNYGTDSSPIRTKATISNCIIQKKIFGYCIYACDGLIENCILSENVPSDAIWGLPVVYNCYGVVKNCTIANNDISGISLVPNPTTLQMSPITRNCVFEKNTDSM